MDNATLYDERFAKVFPLEWEVSVLAKYIGNARILLDVGCGTGRHTLYLAEKGIHILGIDKDNGYVRAAKSKSKKEGLVANIDLIIADARFLPVRPGFFDVAICMGNVLGDVGVNRKDRIAMIREMANSSKSQALLVTELVHRYWHPTDLLVWLYRYTIVSIQRLLGISLEYGDYTEALHADHCKAKLKFHAFTTLEAKRLFTSQGFHYKIEKRARFFHDWFIVVATQ